MVNIFSPFGVQDIQRRDGGSPTMGLTKVAIAASDPTPIFTGDPVQNFSGVIGSGGFGEYITQASSGLNTGVNWYAGVFRGCEYLNLSVGRVVWSSFWPGGVQGADAIAYVSRDPDMFFSVQCTSAAILGSSNIGQNFTVTATASQGNTITGQSAVALASSVSGSSGSGGLLRLIDFYSNYIGGFPPGISVAGGSGFVNGTDNTNAGQIVVVALNNIGPNQTIGLSSAV